jgi:hypothetical protein
MEDEVAALELVAQANVERVVGRISVLHMRLTLLVAHHQRIRTSQVAQQAKFASHDRAESVSKAAEIEAKLAQDHAILIERDVVEISLQIQHLFQRLSAAIGGQQRKLENRFVSRWDAFKGCFGFR